MTQAPELTLACRVLDSARPARLRSMREFAESEIIIPDGPFEGRRFSCSRQPYTRLWFDAVASNYWRRFVTTGPTQSGKTLMGFIIPTLYHLFEVRETVICGLPIADMAGDKWNEDLLPAIQASRYRDLLPSGGAGSKGGTSNLTAIRFKNGATLRFMTGGGGDKARAGFTSRILVITETDGMDESGGSSREADKITQLEGRTRAFGDRARTYMECTVSLNTGRTWREYNGGTQSRLALRCPHCAAWVTPEREHLVGWQDAEDIIEAGEKARLVCPSCGQLWSDEDRSTANASNVLLHRGQSVAADGSIVGDLPRTNTLGFRWTAANNMLVRQSVIGQDEWKASRAANQENAEKEMRQFVWALPHQSSTVDLVSLDANSIVKRVSDYPRGYVPTGTRRITVGVDVGKWLCHWIAVAWLDDTTSRVIDYGRLEVPSRDMAEDRAIVLALRNFRDTVLKDGWESEGGRRTFDLAFIDSGYESQSAYAVCGETGPKFWPVKGFGSTQRDPKKYVQRARSECRLVGEGFQVVQLPPISGQAVLLVEVNADHWKSRIHMQLQTPANQAGALLLFRPGADVEHLSIAKHFTAEKKVEEFVAGRGLVTRWEAISRNNHWLDALAYASVAASAIGDAKPAETPTQPPPDDPPYNPISGHKGRW
jgi:phage terminase large subunit GpA-like protein